MIIREWRGRASASKAEAYPRHFREQVVPELRRIPGFIGAHLSRRKLDDQVEFLVLTRWQSMESIRAFAIPRRESLRRHGFVTPQRFEKVVITVGARRGVRTS